MFFKSYGKRNIFLCCKSILSVYHYSLDNDVNEKKNNRASYFLVDENKINIIINVIVPMKTCINCSEITTEVTFHFFL